MTKITPKYVSTANTRKRLYICWSTVLIHFNECHMLSSHSYPFFLSLTPHISNFFHRRYSTVNNIDFVIYPTIQNHPPVSSYERGEKRGEVEEVEEKKKKKGRGGKYSSADEDEKERQVFTQPWLEIPRSLSYTLFNAIEFPLRSAHAPPLDSFSICRPRMHGVSLYATRTRLRGALSRARDKFPRAPGPEFRCGPAL